MIVSRKWEVILYSAWGWTELLGVVTREYPCLPGFSLLPAFFSGQQKPCQAITSFIDAWVILSFGTDVASQETIVQRAILNTWITPQNHKLLMRLHVVILKCKDGKWEKNRTREKFKWWNAKVTQTKKEHPIRRKMIKQKPKYYSTRFFPLYLQNHTFKTQPHERISFNCVDVYIVLNVSRRKYRQIRYLCLLPHATCSQLVYLACCGL